MKKFEDKADFEVKWMPYQLRPHDPVGIGKPRKGYGRELLEMGKEVGINFSSEGMAGNTFDSHRLLSWAYKKGGPKMQDALVEELFKLYFEQGKSMGDHDILVKAGEKVGLSGVKAFLDSDEEKDQVKEDLSFEPIPGMPVMSVPHYKFGPQLSFPGAQEPRTFELYMNRVLKKMAEAAAKM